MKTNEFQNILNSFPEGVFMASYKNAQNEVDQSDYLPQGM